MNKSELRIIYKKRRETLSAEDLDNLSLTISNQLLSIQIWNHSFYHIFLPIEGLQEVNTEYILNILAGKDKHIVISKSNFSDYSMAHFLLSDDTVLKPNSYGIPEPENGIPIDVKLLDVVFVPLLAFDQNGNRVGYGKGFYDRFLKDCRSDTLKIGLSFFSAETINIPTETSDISLDYCITPDKVYVF